MNLYMECGGEASPTSGDNVLAMKHARDAPSHLRPGEPKRRCHFIPRRTPYRVRVRVHPHERDFL
jgi:hypothetical protein